MKDLNTLETLANDFDDYADARRMTNKVYRIMEEFTKPNTKQIGEMPIMTEEERKVAAYIIIHGKVTAQYMYELELKRNRKNT